MALVVAGGQRDCVRAFPAQADDLSDRDYHAKVLHLIRGAKESVSISMYLMRPQEPGAKGFVARHPVDELMSILTEVALRGVQVTLYLNSHFKESGGNKAMIGKGVLFDELRRAGGLIHVVSDSRRLHDKLIVVDARYVVEGSMNWSMAALRTNWESATLIDSPALAEVKLARMAGLPLEGAPSPGSGALAPESPSPAPSEAEPTAPLPVSVPGALATDAKYVGTMLRRHDERALDLYFHLLLEGASREANSFPLDFERTSRALKLPSGWDKTRKRRQIIKVLRKLEKDYRLARTEFRFGKDAWIELIPIPGTTFQLPPVFFELEPPLSLKAKCAFLIREWFASESKPLPTYVELGRMVGVPPRSLGDGFRELAAHPLVALDSAPRGSRT